MEQVILDKIDEISSQMILSIKEILKIDSVETEAKEGAPFGIGVKEALEKTLDLAKSLGFMTKNIDNYIGYASLGNSEDYVCAIGHLDVVPPLEGWKHPPFSGYEEGGVIYSRGVLDNKGPILSCLFALYALKELNLSLKREVRIIFGCDEETGFEDLKYYLTKEKPPIMGFTPDCKYPVVYAERGRAVIKITGGDIKSFFEMINTYILNSKDNGENFNIDYKDEEFGILQMRNYHINYNEKPSISLTISYPASVTVDKILENIKKTLPDYDVELTLHYLPVKFEKDSFLVKTLVETYETVTHKDGTPVTTTGGTYAKLMPNIVPFGPSFPGQKGIGHLPNEWMNVDDIITNAKIYALSLYKLANGDL